MSKVTIDRLTSVFLKIRAERERLKRDFDMQYAELGKKQDLLREKMLEICKAQNATSLKTESGTVVRVTKSKYWTSDWDSMYKFILEHKMPQLLTRSLQQSNLKEFLEENPDLFPPGLNIESEESISVRKPTKKK